MCKERHAGRVGDAERLANEVAKLPDGESGEFQCIGMHKARNHSKVVVPMGAQRMNAGREGSRRM